MKRGHKQTLVWCFLFMIACSASCAPEDWPESAHDVGWWLRFTYSNLQHYASSPIATNEVAFVLGTSMDGHGCYAIVVRRKNVPPYRIPPLHHPEWFGSEARLESNAAVDYLCNATGLSWPQIVKEGDFGPRSFSPPLLYLAFFSSTNTVVGFKALKTRECRLPDADKQEIFAGRVAIEGRMKEPDTQQAAKEDANTPSQAIGASAPQPER